MRRLTDQQVNDIMYDVMDMGSAELCREIFDRGYAQAEKDAEAKHYTAADIDRAFWEGRKSVFSDRSAAAYLLDYKEEHHIILYNNELHPDIYNILHRALKLSENKSFTAKVIADALECVLLKLNKNGKL